MGEVNTAPEVAAKAVEDLTAMEVDPEKGERLFKAAIIQSNKGATYRMLSKSLRPARSTLSTTAANSIKMASLTPSGGLSPILKQFRKRLKKKSRPFKRR